MMLLWLATAFAEPTVDLSALRAEQVQLPTTAPATKPWTARQALQDRPMFAYGPGSMVAEPTPGEVRVDVSALVSQTQGVLAAISESNEP